MIRDFFLALGFFTRIPVPNHPNYSDEAMRRSALYYPLVGLLIGCLTAVIYLLADLFWSTTIAVILSMAASFLFTGGFHEDGWADTFDGLGGAFSVEKKLAIMTDSRLGTYGSLALWVILTLKAASLIELLPSTGVIALLLAHSLSRWTSMSAMVFSRYVRVEKNKAKPVVHKLPVLRWLMAFAFTVPAIIFLPWLTTAYLVISCGIIGVAWHWLLKRQIGGYTGDTLGALQQITEVIIYLVWLCI